MSRESQSEPRFRNAASGRNFQIVWPQVSVCLLGVALYLASFYPVFLRNGSGSSFLQQLGIGVLVFGLTTFTLTRYNAENSRRQLEAVQDEVKRATIETFELVSSAQRSGIATIYPIRKEFCGRLESELEDAARVALETGKSQCVRMMGISLRDFFFQNGPLREATEKALRTELLSFQILLIDPFSQQAVLRSERESQTPEHQEYVLPEEHLSSTLFSDVQSCTKYLRRFTKMAPRIEVRFYETAPSCFLIFLNQSVFVETYHYGRSGIGGLRGGRVPVLEFHSHTDAYAELQGHFDYVWSKSAGSVLNDKLAEAIRDPRGHQILGGGDALSEMASQS